jgi:imidazolonepropionase-like amidohydrolase
VIIAVAAMVGLSGDRPRAQERKFVTPPTQVVAIRAGHLFDSKSGSLLNNQVVLIRGDRITDVGASVTIPAALG